jgi:protease I
VRALVISADGFEDSELFAPCERLRAEGMNFDVASLTAGPITGKHGGTVEASLGIEDVRREKYDILILPGGKAPTRLRKNPAVIAAVRAFCEAGKPVAAICHGPQILISAGVMAGRVATCYASVAKELRAAGAQYRDAEVVTDGNLITSRHPGDLPAFLREIVKKLRERATQTACASAVRPGAAIGGADARS